MLLATGTNGKRRNRSNTTPNSHSTTNQYPLHVSSYTSSLTFSPINTSAASTSSSSFSSSSSRKQSTFRSVRRHSHTSLHQPYLGNSDLCPPILDLELVRVLPQRNRALRTYSLQLKFYHFQIHSSLDQVHDSLTGNPRHPQYSIRRSLYTRPHIPLIAHTSCPLTAGTIVTMLIRYILPGILSVLKQPVRGLPPVCGPACSEVTRHRRNPSALLLPLGSWVLERLKQRQTNL